MLNIAELTYLYLLLNFTLIDIHYVKLTFALFLIKRIGLLKHEIVNSCLAVASSLPRLIAFLLLQSKHLLI